jgi:uncharacterized protein
MSARKCAKLSQMVTLRNELPRPEAARFLRACFSDITTHDDCFVWNGWQYAIAMLGLAELKPLVEQAFERGDIPSHWMSFQQFEDDLQRAIDHPTAPWRDGDDYTLFGDTIEELSTWHAFSPDDGSGDGGNYIDRERQWSSSVPAVNPFKDVGRNDPCPCGSGKKYKKCCLN